MEEFEECKDCIWFKGEIIALVEREWDSSSMHFSVAEMAPLSIYFEFSVRKHSCLNSECFLGCEITQRVMASPFLNS